MRGQRGEQGDGGNSTLYRADGRVGGVDDVVRGVRGDVSQRLSRSRRCGRSRTAVAAALRWKRAREALDAVDRAGSAFLNL
jgi:hypothetical protein